ncbi:MAG: InlB B-repeat-containing protein [Lachnospiraceae bacterium]|nr:InlB B-repeat-containing protein [Lachnospiraceae bacterium]
MKKKRFVSLLLAAVMVLTLVGGVGGTAKAARVGYYDIEFRSNGYSGETGLPAKIEIKDGAQYQIPTSPLPSRPGYTCIGYSTTKGGNVVAYHIGEVIRVSKGLILYPVYSGIGQYTVRYVADGGTNIPATVTVNPGSKYTISTQQPQKNKYLFLGWSRNSSATNRPIHYKAGKTITVTSDMTLYPVWATNQFAAHVDDPMQGNANPNACVSIKYNKELYVGSDSILMRGWTIFDRGIQSFSYRIVNNKTGKVETIANPNPIERKPFEAGVAAKRDSLAASNGFDYAAECARYELQLPNDKLAAGSYTVYITATTKDGNPVDVAKMTFTIQNKYNVRYYSGRTQNKPKKEEARTPNQVINEKDCETIVSAPKVNYGYHRVWYNKFDPFGDRYEEVKMPVKVTKPLNLFYIDQPNTAYITFKNEDGTTIARKKLKTGDRFTEYNVVGIPKDPQGKQRLFVGWSVGPYKVGSLLYQPEHVCVFGENDPELVLYAVFIEKNKLLDFSYRVNYQDLSNTRAKYNSHVVEVATRNYNQGVQAGSAVSWVKAIGGKAISLVVKNEAVASGATQAFGCFVDAVSKPKDTEALKSLRDEAVRDHGTLVAAWTTLYEGVEEYIRNSPEYDRQIDLRLYYDGNNTAINIYDSMLKPIGK